MLGLMIFCVVLVATASFIAGSFWDDNNPVRMPFVILTCILAFLTIMFYSASVCDIKDKAIERNAAYYDQKTGDFKWVKIKDDSK